jgi:hypothetical protein
MQAEYLIAVDEFCARHNIEISFISSLQKTGLIEVITVKDTRFIDVCQLQQLEKIVRFYYEFDINLEGIETIINLLRQIDRLQAENISLKNRLRIYELNE